MRSGASPAPSAAPGIGAAEGPPLRALLARFTRASAVLHLPVRIAVLLGLSVALELWLTRFTHLPQESYSSAVLALEVGRRLASTHPVSLFTLLALTAAAGAAIRYRSLGPRWRDFEHGTRLRWLIGLTAAVLAWVFATDDYNFYFDQPHHLDRLLPLVLLVLLLWRPVFVFAFLLAVLTLGWQFTYPIGGFSWAAPMLLIRVLFLFGALWLTRSVTDRVRTADFVFLLCCLIADHYWVSGLGKLQLGWLARDQIALLLPATYANGWLGFLAPDTISALTRTLLWFNWPMKIATVLIEAGAIIALWRRGTLRTFLVAWIGLHLGIFLLTGICFWMWMLLDAAVLALFFSKRSPPLPIFTRYHFLLSLVLIGGSTLWFRPPRLAWLDARVSYTYRLEGVDERGQRYSLAPRFFAPYDYQFTLSAFRYLVPAPRLAITWGAMNQRELADALEVATTPEQVLALEPALGRNVFDPQRSAALDEFVRSFVGSWNRRSRGWRWWEPLQAPPLLWTFPRGDSPAAGDSIAAVLVHEVTSLFDGERYLEIRTLPVRLIALPPEAPAARR